MITIFVGRRGRGKTLLMTRRLYRRYKMGYKIYTNYNVEFPHEKLDAVKLMEMGKELHNCAMGVDELQTMIDSRNSMSIRNKLISYFILQTRKRNVVLFGTTQHERMIDIRLRQQTDYWVFCQRIGKSSKFVYRVVDGPTGIVVKKCRYDGRRFFGMYDTEEIIDFLAALDEPKPRAKRPVVEL